MANVKINTGCDPDPTPSNALPNQVVIYDDCGCIVEQDAGYNSISQEFFKDMAAAGTYFTVAQKEAIDEVITNILASTSAEEVIYVDALAESGNTNTIYVDKSTWKLYVWNDVVPEWQYLVSKNDLTDSLVGLINGAQQTSEKNQPNGYVGLDGNNQIPPQYLTYPVNSVNGETGDVVIDANDVGLGNVNNTSDANKPISTATQAALDLKEDKANKATTLSSPDNTKFPTTLAVSTGLGTKEPTIAAGLTTQYWRGDKSWQILPPPAISGRIIFVDKDAVNSTDTRTGLSKYAQNQPFKTLTAAVAVWANGDIIQVRAATTAYVENLVLPSIAGAIKIILLGAILDGTTTNACAIYSPSALAVFIEMKLGAQIKNTGDAGNIGSTGTVQVNGNLIITGDSNVAPYCTISSVNSFCTSGGGNDPEKNFISSVKLVSTNYQVANGPTSQTFINCLLLAPNNNIIVSSIVQSRFIFCRIKSKLTCIKTNGVHCHVEGCSIYSETELGIYANGGTSSLETIIRDNKINAKTGGIFLSSGEFYYPEVVNNQIGVRDASTKSIEMNGGSGLGHMVNNTANRPTSVPNLPLTSNNATDNIINTADTTGRFPIIKITY